MSVLTSVIIFAYYIINISYIIYLYGRYKICPELLWVALQLMMFFGVTHFIESNVESDNQLIRLYLLGLVTYILFSGFFRVINPPMRILNVSPRLDYYKARKPYLYLMMLVCIAFCAIFFQKGGGNVFLNGLRAMISGAEYSTKYSRMGLLSISGVGYIYQLRVIVLPLCVLYYIMINKKKPSSFGLAIIMLIFLIGTGQRGGLVSFMAIVLITIYYWLSSKRESEKEEKPKNRFKLYIGIIGVAGVLFGLSTIMNGRISEGGSLFSAIVKRFLEDNQSCAVYGFRYIKMQEIQHGKDWLMQFRDILPGQNSYISLDTRIFAYMHGGSMAGTSPACIWGSGYYNFGVFGVIIIAIFAAFITSTIHSYFSRRECDEVRIIVYSGLQFLVAYWVAAGPVTLFNNGFITVILFYWVMQFALKYRIVIGKVR